MKYFLYFLPFLLFIAGYTTLSWLTHVSSVVVPPLMGIPLVDAIKTLSDLNLNVRIVGMQEESDVPEGIVISHMPNAGSLIKSHQRVFMIISKQPELVKAPSFAGMSIEHIDAIAQKQALRVKKFFITSATHRKNTVIAQSPHEGEPLPDKTVILYCSSGEESIVLMPDLRGIPVPTVEAFCARNELPLEIIYARQQDAFHGYDRCVVKHQRPLAGSLIDVHKGLKFQISIEKHY